MNLISICIPTYEAHGMAKTLLTRNFDMFLKQTYKNFEVIVSDNSKDNIVENLCKDPKYSILNIKYISNPKRKGPSENVNNAIKNARGDLIKVLHMDDYLSAEDSLQKINDNFKGHWLVTGCGHDDGSGEIKDINFPIYNKRVYLGKNTIGSPSTLTFKREDNMFFDDNLIWLNDCDYYKRLHDKYGEPSILNEVNVIIGVGKHQTTSNIAYKTILKETLYVWAKYHNNALFKLINMW